MQRPLGAAKDPLTVATATDGAASHAQWPGGPAQLTAVRRAELAEALRELGASGAGLQHGDLPDSRLDQHERELDWFLEPLIRSAGVVLCPHPRDGHPDHEAVGRSAVSVARRLGVPCFAYWVWLPIWFGGMEAARGLIDARVRWADARRVDLAPVDVQAKVRALGRFASQRSGRGGVGPVVTDELLRFHSSSREVLFAMSSLPTGDDRTLVTNP